MDPKRQSPIREKAATFSRPPLAGHVYGAPTQTVHSSRIRIAAAGSNTSVVRGLGAAQ